MGEGHGSGCQAGRVGRRSHSPHGHPIADQVATGLARLTVAHTTTEATDDRRAKRGGRNIGFEAQRLACPAIMARCRAGTRGTSLKACTKRGRRGRSVSDQPPGDQCTGSGTDSRRRRLFGRRSANLRAGIDISPRTKRGGTVGRQGGMARVEIAGRSCPILQPLGGTVNPPLLSRRLRRRRARWCVRCAIRASARTLADRARSSIALPDHGLVEISYG